MADENIGIPVLDHINLPQEIIDHNKFDMFMDRRTATLKDQGVSKMQASVAMSAILDASRSGSLVNGRVYRAKYMNDSTKKWLTPYEKPVLPHHDSSQDAIGRVQSAKFESFINRSEWENDHIIMIDNNLDQKKGSGRLVLTAKIIDTDAIDKVLDGRYSTVSIGFQTSYMKCSICGEDWRSSGLFFMPCEHKIGKHYGIDENSIFWTGKKTKKKYPAYLYCGEMDPKEVSFVNTPAQSFANVIGTQVKMAEDSSIDEDSFNQTMNMVCIGKARSEDSINSLVLSDGYTSQEVLVDDLVSKSTRKLTVVDVPAIDDNRNADADDKDDSTDGNDIGDANLKPYTDEEFACLNILRNMYDCGTLEPTVEESVAIASFSDKKLTPEQRKKLPSSAFCGPDRSFPVPDCSHVTAALRLLGRYKGPGDKDKIRSCVLRKAKKMGCKVSESAKKSKNGDNGDGEPTDLQTGDSNMSDKIVDNGDDQGNKNSQDHSNDSDKVTVQTLTDKIQDLSGIVTTKESEISSLQDELKEANDTAEDVQKQLTDSLVTQYVSMRRVLKGDIPEDDEKYKSFVDGLKVRTVDSLRDSIDDMTEEFNQKVDEIQKGNINDSAGSVSDPTDDGDNPGNQDGTGGSKNDQEPNKHSVKDML